MREIKEKLENELLGNICPFWNNLKDENFGGFYGATNREHEILIKSPKGLVYISRILYSFSCLYKKYKKEEFLKNAQWAYKFLIEKMYDNIYGGFYWSCDYSGNPLNSNKHIYGQSFALYGLSAYYEITNDRKVLSYIFELVNKISNLLEEFPKKYTEEFLRDFKPTTNQIMEGHGFIPKITTNSLLHIAEALGLCYKVTKNVLAKTMTIKVLDIIFKYGYDFENANLYQFLDYDLKKQDNIYSYGHNLEVSWLFKEILDQCDIHNNDYEKILIEMFERNFKNSYTGEYVINENVDGKIDKSAIWWVQAEALAALSNMYKLTKNDSYIESINNITTFILEKLAIPNKEWYWSLDENFIPQNDHSIAEMWKANYHNVRGILRVLEVENGE